MGYSNRVIKGISWMAALQLSIRTLSLAKIFIIARILSPSQFGIFGIAALVLSLFELLTETGINIILIQSQKDLHKYINSAWVVSIFRGILISLVIVIASPLIVLFFNTPDALGVLLFTSLIPLVRGFINPAIVKFQKDLEFNREFWLRSTLFVIDAGASIALVVIFHSVYGLVWGLLISAFFEVILSFLVVKPLPRFILETDYLREIFHRGKWITLYGVLDYFAKNGDNIIVGKVLGASSLGVYQAAYRIATLTFTELTEVINKVFFPVFSKISENKKELRQAFLKSILLLSLIIIPLSLLIFIYAKEIVLLFLGEKWLDAVMILQVLAVYGMLRSLVGYPLSVLFALQKQRSIAYMTFLRAFTLLVTLVPFIYQLGLVGAAYAAILSVVVEAPIVSILLYRILKQKNISLSNS